MKNSRGCTLIAMLIITSACLQQTNPSEVKTFEDCVKAGYRVTDSAPRECKTPDGRTIKSDKDIFDATRDTTCGDDSECALVNIKNGFSCCHTGRCTQPDYSKGEWEAVNRDWFARERKANCPEDNTCGPPPTCPEKNAIGAYKAACVNSRCIKIRIT